MSVRIRHARIPARTLASLARRVVGEVLALSPSEGAAEVSVLFVGDSEMRELNLRYRGIPRPTDVLAFAMRDGAPSPPTPGTRMLGDIVVSLDTAERQALECAHSVRREVAMLLIHGGLHLLGFDHEHGARPRAAASRAMQQAQDKVLAQLEAFLVV